MEFLDQLMTTIQSAEDPVPYYIGGLLVFVILLVVLRSILHTFMIVAFLGLIVLGVGYFSGNSLDLSTVANNLKSSVSSFTDAASESVSDSSDTKKSFTNKKENSKPNPFTSTNKNQSEEDFLSALFAAIQNAARDLLP